MLKNIEITKESGNQQKMLCGKANFEEPVNCTMCYVNSHTTYAFHLSFTIEKLNTLKVSQNFTMLLSDKIERLYHNEMMGSCILFD